MKFGPVPVEEATGAILAHSLRLKHKTLKKGRRLTAGDVARLGAEGLAEVTVAQLEPGDAPEDQAAARLAAALAPDAGALGLSVSTAATGRVNLFAARPGVLRVDAAAITAVNAVDEAITVATLSDYARVRARQMAATVKIIPYAAPETAVARAVAALGGGQALEVKGVLLRKAALILTLTSGIKPSVAGKGAEAVRGRLAALGVDLISTVSVPHRTEALAAAVAEAAAKAELVLVLTASATSDRADVCPAAIVRAGGVVERFGMPVDPGNLLVLGALGGAKVIGLPGCARSPKLNGVDWVLERLVCGVEVGGSDIAAMGVGGLLVEIPTRPAPRAGGAGADEGEDTRAFVSAVVLAAGASRRMGGADKLTELVDGVPLIRRVAAAAARSRADEVLVVLGAPDDPRTAAREAALGGSGARIVHNPESAEGMASSLRAGLAARADKADAVVVIPADMPLLAAAHIDAVIAAFDPKAGHAICRAQDAEGRPGHPVLFGRRFFEALARLSGDQGARPVIVEHPDFVVEVPTPGQGATADLDTREDWRAFREGGRG